ncbi:hypothetical protein [Yinghuangia soli]|uniref:Uncharacterized protein n=1 Tax=Yinghuangia soli TaxID=2908204 RepID=A0AA41Q0U6_9ACTN|nr:hypothetical protein [Yinghuangia soli]MCF2528369.1 hypothetical protein [Yinghuangia soli]
MNPYALLLDAAPEPVQAALVQRLAPRVRKALLSDGALGATVVSCALQYGTSDDRAALAGNQQIAPEALVALSAQADAAIAQALCANPKAPREALLPVVRLLPRDELLLRDRPLDVKSRLLDPRRPLAVELDDPHLTAAVLTGRLPRNPEGAAAVMVRGYLGLLRTAGAEAVRTVSAAVPEPIEARVGVVAEALRNPTDAARLDAAFDWLTGPDGIVARLRTRLHPDWALLAPRGPLDWPTIEAAHRSSPFQQGACEALARQVGCPPTLRAAAVRPHPPKSLAPATVDRDEFLRKLPKLPREGIREYPGRDIGAVHEAGVLTATDILGQGAPAFHALRIVQLAQNRTTETRQALSALTTASLGTHSEPWTVALTLLPDFAGTLPELLATAGAVAR